MQRDTLPPITGEHLLGPLSNIQDGAWLDTAANGLLGEGSFKRTYFDIIHMFLQIKHTNPAECYHLLEMTKNFIYEQRIIEIEHLSFIPLMMSSSHAATTINALPSY